MPKILIVDDDRTTVRLLQTLLQLDGFEVSSASRGQEALQVAAEVVPDIFLVDFHLNDMTALEFMPQLRDMAAFAQTPVVIASGMDKEDEVLAVGAACFLLKPFDPNALAGILNNLLG